MSGNFKNRHHVEPKVKLYSPREESFPIPLKYIDVSRTTHTNLDVKQEKPIDDYWNIDGSRDLSDPWTGFTQFTLLEEKATDGYIWSGERLTRKQLTSRPDHLWPELWKSMGKHAKLKEKQKWSVSIFNDLSCDRKGNKEECLANAGVVKVLARKFGVRQWSFIGPGSEKKWYSGEENSPQGAWDHIAEEMLLEFAGSGHPTFRATTPLSRGILKSKGHGKLSVHFAADELTN